MTQIDYERRLRIHTAVNVSCVGCLVLLVLSGMSKDSAFTLDGLSTTNQKIERIEKVLSGREEANVIIKGSLTVKGYEAGDDYITGVFKVRNDKKDWDVFELQDDGDFLVNQVAGGSDEASVAWENDTEAFRRRNAPRKRK